MSTPSVDLAVLNATVVDGTGAPPVIADIAIDAGRIVKVGTFSGRANRVIDAWGRVACPGFVDLHGHSDYSLLADPMAHSKIFQGVTTEVGGNCGYHAAPVFGRLFDERHAEQQRALGLDANFRTAREYVAAVSAARPTINYAQQVGYNTLRSAVTMDHDRPLSEAERARLRALVREQLDEGYVGVSYGLAYAPACFSRTEELLDVAEEAAAFKVPITFHLRDEGDQLLEAIDEALHIGRTSGAATHIGHFKTFRKPNWGKLDEAIGRLEAAKAAGLKLTVDRYPHLAMNTQLKFALPKWALEGGIAQTQARLREPQARRKVLGELAAMHRGEGSQMLISLVTLVENRECEGRFLDDLAQRRGSSPDEVLCDLISTEGDSVFATFFGMSRENLDRILKLDYAMVASDASVQAIHRQAGGGRPHPRCFDTFPCFLAEWVLARNELTLQAAVRKITSLPADTAGLKDRGRLGEGQFADLTLLRTEALSSQVSYEQPIALPPGVDLVVVNGQVVVEDGQLSGARPGAFLPRRSFA